MKERIAIELALALCSSMVRAAPLSVMECPSHHNRQAAAAANDGGQGLELGLGQYNGGAL